MEIRDILNKENEEVRERAALSAERIREIAQDPAVPEPYRAYFRKTAGFLLLALKTREEVLSGTDRDWTLEQLEARNHALYEDILPEHYGESFADPAYAARILGEE